MTNILETAEIRLGVPATVTRYAVRTKATGRVTPIMQSTAMRFLRNPDAPDRELLVCTVTVTEWEKVQP
jgi:hypothetical protein